MSVLDYISDSYSRTVHLYGMTDTDEATFRAEMEAMSEEAQESAQKDFEITHDDLGHFVDLFEPFDFEYQHDANSVRLRHFSNGRDESAWVEIKKDNNGFSTESKGVKIPNATAQTVINDILFMHPQLDREDVFRDAALYGWGLPEFSQTRRELHAMVMEDTERDIREGFDEMADEGTFVLNKLS